MSYDYFLASLPLLTIRGKAPLASAEYAELLAEQLSVGEACALLDSGLFGGSCAALEATITYNGLTTATTREEEHRASAATTTMAEGDSGGDVEEVVRLWERFDAGLRGEIGRMRAVALKIAADPYWPQMDSFIYIEELRRIFQQVNPLERELQTHDLRWNFLEDLGRAYSGQLGGAVVYYLKLKLLERLQAMKPERAHQALSAIYTQCQTQFQERVNELTAKTDTEDAEAMPQEMANTRG